MPLVTMRIPNALKQEAPSVGDPEPEIVCAIERLQVALLCWNRIQQDYDLRLNEHGALTSDIMVFRDDLTLY